MMLKINHSNEITKISTNKKNLNIKNNNNKKENNNKSNNRNKYEKYKKLIGKEITGLIYSEDNLECAIATAAINAQTKPRNYIRGNIFKKIFEDSKRIILR